MELTVTLTIKEGMVYDCMKTAIQDFFANLTTRPTYEERTGKLCSGWGYKILRNGKPVTDSDIEPLKDNELGDTKYTAIIYRGMKEVGTIEM